MANDGVILLLQKGAVSDHPISFHYVDPKAMYMLAYFTYGLKLYGIDETGPLYLHEYYDKHALPPV